jgi:hypothetical protein
MQPPQRERIGITPYVRREHFSHPWQLQGMVPRADLVAAVCHANVVMDDVDSKASVIIAMELQLSRIQDQLNSALTELVPRSDLTAAKSRCEILQALAAKAAAEHGKALGEVNDRLTESLAAHDELLKSMQVTWSHWVSLWGAWTFRPLADLTHDYMGSTGHGAPDCARRRPGQSALRR